MRPKISSVGAGFSRSQKVSSRRDPLSWPRSREVAGFYLVVPREPSWELEHLWVAPQFARRGIGRALLAHAVSTARACGASAVLIDADPNAEAFYLACGAARVGTVAAPIANDRARVRPQLALQVLDRAA